MALSLLPFEEEGNFLARWWRNAIHPFVSLRSVWVEAYRGDSLLAPLGFAYLWVLVLSPLIFLGGKLGLMAIKTKMGPYVAMSLANSIQIAPGILATFLLRPLIYMFLGGCVAHGLLWLFAKDARGHLRMTLRVFGYGWAWILPIDGLLVACSLYLVFNPLAALDGGAMMPTSATAVRVLGLAQLAVGASTLGFVAWGLASIHRISLWKTILATLIALIVLAYAGLVLSLSTSHAFVSAILHERETRRESENNPKARIQRVIKLVEKIQEDTQKSFKKAGLPAPPRSVDLLTGGDWGAAIDLKQALESGFAPSCQVVYDQALAALKGQVIHFSACLGERNPMYFNPEPAPLLPPGSQARAQQINQTLNADQRTAISQARTTFGDAIRFLESEIGPFDASRKRASRDVLEREQPLASAHPSVVPPPPPPPIDPNTPSVRNCYRLPLADLRRMAANGNPDAMNQLGTRLYFGQNETGKEFIPVTQVEGVKWLLKAYDAGFRDESSCYVLGVASHLGIGVPVDPDTAREWNRRGEAIRDAGRQRNPPLHP